MATVAIRGQLTLVELAKRTANNNLMEIAEVLDETREMLTDAVWIEANNRSSHMVTIRTSIPTGTWRKLNYGVPAESSATRQIEEGIGSLESYSKIDRDWVRLAPNPGQARSDEERAFIEGLSQTLGDAVFYGNVYQDPEKIHGFANRYGTLGTRVVGCGGTGSDLTSLWAIQWGRTKVHLIYPRGHKSVGIEMEDLGEDTVSDGAGGEYQAYRTHFQIKVGLVVRDDRNVGRLANIETTGTTNIFDDTLLIQLLNRLQMRGKGAVCYGNVTVLTQIDQQANSKTNVQYTVGQEFGRPVNYFRGVPLKQEDSIVDTESALT
jgi:hypothetical protein